MNNIINTFSANLKELKESKLSSDNFIDHFLDGGFEKSIVTTIYGTPGSGKTNICMITAIKNTIDNKRILYIDSENGFSLKRVEQILGLNEPNDDILERILNNIVLVKPRTFKDQTNIILSLDSYLRNENFDVIIIDSIGMLYRLERADYDIANANKDLGKQLYTLNIIADKYKIPIILTNQVYSFFDDKNSIRVVGGDIINYSSKCLIQLENNENTRRIILKKHRYLKEKSDYFKIENQGLTKVEVIKRWN